MYANSILYMYRVVHIIYMYVHFVQLHYVCIHVHVHYYVLDFSRYR